MIFHYAQFSDTGEISQTISAPYGFIETDGLISDATHYVDVPTRTVHQKQECAHIITANGLSVTIANLPVPCMLTVQNNRHDVQDGTAELAFSHPGDYEIMIESVKYLRWKGSVTL